MTRVLHVFGAGTEVQIDDVTIRAGRSDGNEALGAGLLVTGGDLVQLVRAAILGNEVTRTTSVPLGGGSPPCPGALS